MGALAIILPKKIIGCADSEMIVLHLLSLRGSL